MRKIGQQIAEAFAAGNTRVISNTETDGTCVWLHGNKIMEKVTETEIRVTLAGWPTPTTRSRLNDICEFMGYGRLFHQHKHSQFFRERMIEATEWVTL